MKWSIAKARQRFSELVRKAAVEPQPIYSRGKLVAAVISAESLQEYSTWSAGRKRRSVADAFTDLRGILAEENYALEVSPREDRTNDFAESGDQELERP